MKKHVNKICLHLLYVLLLLTNNSFAQKWKDKWNTTTKNSERTFYESLDDAEQYFKDNPTYVDTPRSGYKDYMRWYLFWKNKIDLDGGFDDYATSLYNFNTSSTVSSHSSSDWLIHGPTNVPQQYGSNENTRGMGWIQSLDVFPSQKNLMYAGSNSGGLYKTSNGGNLWSFVPFANVSMGVQSIAIDPNDSNTVYIATGTTIYAKEYGFGVYKTTNGGSTWSKIYSDSNNPMEVINKVLIDPSNSSNVYIAYRGKIFKSTNGGLTFTQKLNVTQSSNPRDVRLRDLAFKPGNTNVIYAAGKAIYKSTDAGDNWTEITELTTLGKEGFPTIVNQNFQDGSGTPSLDSWTNANNLWSTALVSSRTVARIKPANSVYTKLKELSLGSYYIPINNYNVQLFVTLPAYTRIKIKLFSETNSDSTEIYDSGSENFDRVIDEDFDYSYTTYGSWYGYASIEVTSSSSYNNTSWLEVDYLKIFDKNADRIVLATTPQYPDKLFVGVSSFSPDGNRKLSFEKSNNSGSSFTYMSGGGGDQLENKFNMSVSPTDTNRIYLATVFTSKTTNGWATSSTITQRANGSNRVHDDVRQMLIFDNSGEDLIYQACDGGVSVSSNSGSTWTDKSNNLTVTQFFGIAGKPDNSNLLVGGCQDLGTNLYFDGSWKNTSGGDGYGDPFIDPFNENIMLGLGNGTLYRTTNKYQNRGSVNDAPNAWNMVYAITDYETQSYSLFTNVMYDNINNITQYDIRKSTNRGASGSWNPIALSSVIGNGKISTLAVCESNPNYIYFGEEFPGNGAKIWRTTIGGGTSSGNWVNITSNLPTQYAGITDIEIDPANPNRVWVTLGGMLTGHKVYFRNFSLTDTSWINFSEGIDDSKYNLPVNCIKYWKGSNDGLFIGTDVGIFYRDNSMIEWVEYNNGLHPTVIQDLEINNLDHKIRAATFARGVWESPLPECTYNSESYLVEGPDTITTYTKMNRNIIVEDNGIFVVKSRLIMSNNTKITVKKGGKIVIDGGHITNTCGGMWDGIIVDGSRIEVQSANTHGWCEVKNGGTIENARVAIRSYAGGVVRVIGGNFLNNRYGVSFNLYSLNNNGLHANLSVVANSKFICNKPMVDSNSYMDDGVREGSKSFVSIAQQDGIRVINNDFISTYRPRADLKGTGVVTWSCRSYIHNNDFTGLAFGIESGGYLNALQYNSVYNNEFTDVSLGITETAMAGSQIRENTISLPAYESNAWLMENYGIKLDVPRGFNVSNNSVGVPSTVTTNANTYGVLVKNSDTIPCNIEHNIFEKLQFANQLEGDNDVIGIQCNYYTESVQDWSINPITVGTIHDFGSDINTEIQASNYFPDDTSGSGVKNIRLNENMSFFYNSVSFPDTAKPMDNTINVTVNIVDGTIYDEECILPFDPCGGNPIPCVAYAQDLVNSNSEASSDLIFKCKLNLAQQLRDSGMMEELRQMIEAETNSEWEELKLPIYIEYGESMGVNVQDLIDNLPSGDYKNFMQVILDIKNEDRPLDSVGDIGLTEEIAEIADGSTPISAAARKILELFYGYQYVREAERWEESSMVRHNSGAIKTSQNQEENEVNNEQIKDVELMHLTKPDFLLIPNPSDGNFVVKLLSSASGTLSIVDMHGKVISKALVSKEGELRIEKGTLIPGVYTIRLVNEKESYQLNKRMIILE